MKVQSITIILLVASRHFAQAALSTVSPPTLGSDRTLKLTQKLNELARDNKAEEATALLGRMEREYFDSSGPDESLRPNVFSYGNVLNAWTRRAQLNRICRAQSSIEEISYPARTAEKILDRMILSCESDTLKSCARPNTVCFNTVLAAWAQSGIKGQYAAKKCERLLLKMEQLNNSLSIPSILDNESFSLRPDVVSYSTVLNAWAQSGTGRIGAQRAERVLDRMCQSDDKEIRPNLVAFNTCIKAWAKSGEGSYGARRAEKLLDRMQNYGVTPDLHTWNTIIDCWSKSRSRESGQKAEEILRKMNDQFLISGNIEDMPNIMTYNSVLDAWSKSRSPIAAIRAKAILDHLEKHAEKNSIIRADKLTYSMVINAFAGSREADKVERTEEIFQRMTNAGLQPDVHTYTSIIKGCAYDFDNGEKSYHIAKKYMNQMRESSQAKPNNISYATMLRACKHLLYQGSMFCDNEVERIFKECCEDGQCCQLVISQLKGAASKRLLSKLLPNDYVHPSWRKHVIGRNDYFQNFRKKSYKDRVYKR